MSKNFDDISDFVKNGGGFRTGFANATGGNSDSLDDMVDLHTPAGPDDPTPDSILANPKTLQEVVLAPGKRPSSAATKPIQVSVLGVQLPSIPISGTRSKTSFNPWWLIAGVVVIGSVTTYFLLKKK